MPLDPLEVFPVKTLVAPIHPLPLILRAVTDERHAREHEMIDSKNARDFVHDVAIEAIDRSPDNNH